MCVCVIIRNTGRPAGGWCGVVYVYAVIDGAVIDQDVIGDVGAASTEGRRRYMWRDLV